MEGQEIQSGNTLTSEKPVSITTPAKPLATRDDVLRLIVGLKLDPILRRQHLKREVIIGLVGLRGDGKSGSGAVIALLDYMLNNNPVWSNMAIRTAIGLTLRIASRRCSLSMSCIS